MTIGIDAHVLGTRAGGNETYMRGLLRALRGYGDPARFLVFVNHGAEDDPDASGFTTRTLPVKSSYLRVPLALPWAAMRARLGLLHVQYTAPPLCPCPCVVSMHDIVALRFPESMPFADRHRLRLLSGRTLRNATRIFALTAALRDEIAEAYHLPLDRFDVVPPPLDPLFAPVTCGETLASVRAKYALPERFVLYVGLIQPRKNLARLAEAFSGLRGRGLDHSLVIVGRRAWLYEETLARIDALNLGDRIRFTDYVDRADLPALYSLADAFAYLSLYEGFGIPVLEAMACGCPVVASDDPALKEVAAGNAVHVEAGDTGAIHNALHQILTDASLRAALVPAGLRRARDFTPAATALAALGGYEKALSSVGI